MSNQENISLSFPDEEEITSLFLFEDLVKEYNTRAISSPPHLKMYPLSLKPITEVNSNPIIRPMTREEMESMRSNEVHADDWHRLKKILSDQVTPIGIINNMPNIAAGVTILEMINELGINGKVSYKTVGEKTYVSIKGLAGNRVHLTGTRYLNTHPEIVRFGLAKVSPKDLFKQGFKSSLWVYGAVKILEATELCLKEDGLNPDFFSKIVTDVPKLAITSLVSAAVGGAVVTAGLPVVAGAGLVLVVGIGAGIALEFLDQKIGLTEKLNEAANTMWINLKSLWNGSSDHAKLSLNNNLLEGLAFGGPLIRQLQLTQKGDLFLYTV